MGSITTHKRINSRIADALAQIRPDESYKYIEFGNFLTDVSQFRDPAAHMGAKITIYYRATHGSDWVSNLGAMAGIGEVRRWLNVTMGTPNRRHGKLAEFFEKINLAVSRLLADAIQIPEAEGDYFFERYFSQYYPHEHVDFPYVHRYSHYSSGRRFQRGSRGLIRYLENQLLYISEGLTSVERDWRRSAASGSSSDSQRHDALVRLGHFLHAVEDYYFHSNFCELLWLKQLQQRYERAYEGLGIEVPEDTAFFWESFFNDNALAQRTEGTWIRFKRFFYRRMRYPDMLAGRFGPMPSGVSSRLADDMVYTGGFGASDVFHTMHDAVDGMEETLLQLEKADLWHDTGLVLIETLMRESLRRRLVNQGDDAVNAMIAQHRTQLENREYQTHIDEQVSQGRIPNNVGEALKEAFDIDRWVSSRFPAPVPGLGGLLLKLSVEMQAEVDRSRRTSEVWDRSQLVRDERTNNRASEEQIGSHSLLAKDTGHSGPFRGEAVALAVHASANIARIMAQRVNEAPGSGGGALWWDGILRHYLRFPDIGRQRWERIIFDLQARQGAELADHSLDLGDRPQLVTLAENSPRLQALLSGNVRRRLEQEYQNVETHLDRIYRSL